MLAGAILWWKPHWEICDPLCTLLFTLLVVKSTYHLLHSAVNILLEGTPHGFDQELVRKRFLLIPGVTNVHCLHIWSLTLGKTIVTAHIKAVRK